MGKVVGQEDPDKKRDRLRRRGGGRVMEGFQEGREGPMTAPGNTSDYASPGFTSAAPC